MSKILRKSGRTSIFHEEQQSSPYMLESHESVLGPRQLMYRSGTDGISSSRSLNSRIFLFLVLLRAKKSNIITVAFLTSGSLLLDGRACVGLQSVIGENFYTWIFVSLNNVENPI